MKRYARHIIPFSFALLGLIILGSVIVRADSRPRLRVFHAAPGLSNVDIYLDDTLFFDNVFYRYISDYAPINPGDHTVRVRPAGASPRDPTLIEVNAPYGDNQDYTIVAAGRQGDLQNWRLEDNNQDLPGQGTAKVRVVHASFDTPTTEFCLGQVCRTLAFKENTDYFLLDPGTYTPSVRVNGADISRIKIPPLKLQDNAIHTVFLAGQRLGDPPLQLLYTLDAGEALDTYPPAPPPDGDAPGAPPPAYPPVSGAFLPTKVVGMLAGAILIMAGGVGLWVIRRQK